MDAFTKLSRHTQFIIIGLAVYIILSFFNWQSVDTPLGSFGVSEWHGIMGTVTVLIAIAWFVWELATRLGNVKMSAGGVSNEFTGAGVAIVFLVFSILLFFVKNEIRAWPEYVGTILAIAISIVGIMRGKEEGVTVDHAKAHMASATAAVSSMGSSSGSSESAPPASSPPPPPSSPTMGDAVDEPGPGEGDRPSSTI